MRCKIKFLLLFTILLSTVPNSVLAAALGDENGKEDTTVSSSAQTVESTFLETDKSETTATTPPFSSGESNVATTLETNPTSTATTTKSQEQTTEESKDVQVKEKVRPRLAANEAEVNTWTAFVSAVCDETITKISLTGSFENPSASDSNLSSYQRKNDLEIDGQGNRIHFKDASIRLGSPQNAIGNFHMHDIVLNQKYVGANSEDIVGTRLNYTYGAKWKYRFGNVTTEPGVQRLARASHSEVRVYGKMNIDTRAENFYLGSMIMEDGTQYKGNVNYYNFSVFWYNVAASATSTGASREFTIGNNCRVDAGQTQTLGRTYPAVYSHYLALTVGENSVYNVDMPGNAVRFDDDGAGMTIKKGAIVNLTSKQDSGSVVAFSNNNTYLNAEPGSYFYVIGTSSQPLINVSANGLGTGNVTRTGNTFTLNSPAQYDLRNLNNTKSAVNVANGNRAENNFYIFDSDIDLWNVGVPVLGPSSETYAKVPSLSVAGSGTKEVVSTSVSGLQQFKQANYRRISGMNQNPKIEWTPVTDADKTIEGRVVIGEVPDNNGLVDGEIKYIPVYASENQAQVTLTDTYGNIRSDLATDANGYIRYKETSNPAQFQKAGEKITGIAKRGPWITPAASATTVIDATPPEPAKVDNSDAIQSITTKLTGTGEPNSIITLTVNGQPQANTSQVVNSQGKWELDISSLQITRGDVIQIFLQDQSGLITQLSEDQRPSTNNDIGNINPKEDLNYRDATFKAATKVIVVGNLSLDTVPDKLEFGSNNISNQTQSYQPTINGKLVISDTRGGAKKPWRLTLHQSEALKNGTVSLEDDLSYTSSLGEKQITTATQIVESGKFTTDGSKEISANWTGNQGFKLTVPVEKQRIGDYTGKLAWQLEDVPGN
ncbi:WxL domain-containing protein [Enterococcus sp. SMC-9]|uniref:WxL domain-containing protein n=1 Tax=Enterococcus sp. SMC-9 TaxID=2862343 RepID=UPI001E565B0F|nr:WxL domain-containing protein [Enterococcus sp. SMC-9]MCD1025504.1 WxL domain-containing protein [Enterococcus sp. SMC-9]